VDRRSILYAGLTRDGTFLIENGKITKSAKNLWLNDSPIFMLNSLETTCVSKRVSAAVGRDLGDAVAVPPIQVRDLDFTSLSDAA
jgi:predicted Zn-dependent protease